MSISEIAPAMDANPPATESIAPWIGLNANDRPRWTSRSSGVDEKAMSSSETASRITKAIPRRLVWRLAKSVDMAAGPAVGSGGARGASDGVP